MNQWDEFLESEKREKALEKRRATTTVASDSEDDADYPDPIHFSQISEKLKFLQSQTTDAQKGKRVRSELLKVREPEKKREIISEWQVATNELPKNPLGVESGHISDHQMSSPSFIKDSEPFKGRLNSPTAWVSDITVSIKNIIIYLK